MLGFVRHSLAGMTLGTGLFITGCASTPTPPQSRLELSPQGITCTKCQVTWVDAPASYGKHITGYIWPKKEKNDTCPDCKEAVTSFFTMGKFQHTCKTCGDTMEVCQAHPTK